MLAYMPHGYCYLWQNDLIWMFAASDGAIALAYLCISTMIFYLWSQTKIQVSPWQNIIFPGFGSFVLLCGGTHVFDVAEIWLSSYRFHVVVEVATAVVSAATAIAFYPVAKNGIGFAEGALLDPLTGLYNRRYLRYELLREKERCDRDLYPIALIIIDLDGFKQANDAYGHQMGDSILKAVAKLLKEQQTRDSDLVGRIGGDELLVPIPRGSVEVAAARAEEIRAAIANLKITTSKGQAIGITASIGVAVYPTHGNTLEDVFAAGDRALYKAKELGRNRVAIAS